MQAGLRELTDPESRGVEINCDAVGEQGARGRSFDSEARAAVGQRRHRPDIRRHRPCERGQKQGIGRDNPVLVGGDPIKPAAGADRGRIAKSRRIPAEQRIERAGKLGFATREHR